MNKTLLSAAALVSALVLSACQNNQAPASSATQSTSASKTNAGSTGICQTLRDDAPGHGRKVVLRCSGQKILASSEYRSMLHSDVPVSFGGGSAIKKNLVTRQAANAFGNNDEAVCVRAFVNAARKFQESARSHGGRRVLNFHSYYDRKPLHGGTFDCEVGTFHGRVVMRGDIGN